MTVGTDDKTALKIHGVKLLSSHDYAVIGRRIICLTTLHCLIRNRNQRIQRRALGYFTRLSCVQFIQRVSSRYHKCVCQ